jgi:Icc-related predicted phosphoesterase
MSSVRLLIVGDPHGSEKLLRLDTRGYDAAIVTGDMGKTDIMRELAWGKIKGSKAAIKQSYYDYVRTAIPVLKQISKNIPTLCVHGNADLSDEDIATVNKKLKARVPYFEKEAEKMQNLVFIDNVSLSLRGVKIGGIGHFTETGWVMEFTERSIERMLMAAIEEEIARSFFSKVGKLDILVSHQPPYGILDKVGSRYDVPKGWKGKHAGSRLLLEYIKRYQPRYVICGHIHECRGRKNVGKTTVINAGCCGNWEEIKLERSSP